jgi:hypothetical protein
MKQSPLHAAAGRGAEKVNGGRGKQKNAGLKAVTLIATLNPVSQVLW